MLNSMQLLPVNDIVQITHVDSPPQPSPESMAESSKTAKKRASTTSRASSSRKKNSNNNIALMDTS